ncbi:glycosyltransferase family 9 protein [Humibacter albus]|uniref:glycosyltransferase family 9 protein n=1 Tax=Humibacter albus TaxID=427754 RepID=UPI000525EE42|nr:glycosyltransferase family 9 protein [Humibacter albus]
MSPEPSMTHDRPLLLALRALKLGDLLVAVPALKGLARTFGDHELLLAAPAWLDPIARLVPGLGGLLPTSGLDEPLSIDAGVVDIAANLHGNGPESRARISALDARLVIQHAAEHRSDPREPCWLDGIQERRRWVRLVNAFGADARENDVAILTPRTSPPLAGAVVVHVGAFYGSRQWPVERFAEVAATLAGEGERVVVTGSEADRGRAMGVVEQAGLPSSALYAGALGLDELAALVSAARLVISADTGVAHLASAYRRPSVIVFGPAPVEEWGPPPGPHIALTDAALRHGDAFADAPDPALLAVTAHDVLDASRGLLAASESIAMSVPSRSATR